MRKSDLLKRIQALEEELLLVKNRLAIQEARPLQTPPGPFEPWPGWGWPMPIVTRTQGGTGTCYPPETLS